MAQQGKAWSHKPKQLAVLAGRRHLAKMEHLTEVPFLEGLALQEVTAQSEETAPFCFVATREIEVLSFCGGTYLLEVMMMLEEQCSQGRSASAMPCPELCT